MKKRPEVDESLRWHRELLLEKTAQALRNNGFAAAVFANRQNVRPFLIDAARDATIVGFGGSITLAQIGFAKELERAGKTLLSHGRPGLSPKERFALMRRQLSCDIFFTSTNALTINGQLVNIDGTGNRVGAMAFGPPKVVVVAGVNKIVRDLDSALRRVKEVVVPPNARRMGYAPPCTQTGICVDCNSPERVCRITAIIERKPRDTEITVCLVNEHLGY
ncbi:YkgG family uncharacterized protein [Geothermobacter ehrlichii]|uniref:YkgG family uncharacterized protein n=1 Tax=Geothermobacter ehrlichii TaxID=213224 RepID=A0A5D3WGM1_9BACT|nr:lactate utilization protein [Geothermobacter ehrlichii]TYO95267.1 YkgG family uncharacterized protein [Geothermobacter ehrlichii]